MNYQINLWGKLCRWTAIIGVILLPLISLTSSNVSAQTSPEEFYFYLGQEKVYLELSTDMLAVRFVEGLTRQEIEALVEAETSLQPLAERQELPGLRLFLLRVREGVSRAGLLRLLASLNSRAGVLFANPVFRFPDAKQTMTDQFIVQFKAGLSQEAIAQFNTDNSVEIVQELTWVPHTYILRVSPGKRVLETANLYAESGLVHYAEPNWVRLLQKAIAPNDPHYPQQWGMENTGTNPPDGVGTLDADIDAQAAWDISTGSPDIVIAIVDEGTELDHEDLDSKIVAHYSAIPGDPNGGDPNNTWDAHGTNCAGIAAAETNNNQGVAGVCWDCSLMAVQIAYSPGPGEDWITYDSWIADGMTWAVDHGAGVLSNSWGGGSPSSLINNAIHYAVTQGRDGLGSVVLFASGNEDRSSVSWPASNDETIAVGATSPCDERKNPSSCDDEYWWGSNYGSDLDVVAPGVEWWATDLMGSAGYDPGNYFDHFNGTSSATPTAAGLAGLILSYKPCLNEAQVQEIMEQSADDQVGLPSEDTPGWDEYMGWGRINAVKGLILAEETVCSRWRIETVDSGGSVGQYTSLALDAAGYPHISYHLTRPPVGALEYAHWDGWAWQIETVDSVGYVGWYTSLALDAAGYPHISYQDNSNHDLKYAYWNGWAWQIETVDSGGSVGMFTSLALDAAGHPHISYHDWSNDDLKYARWDGSAWQIEPVDSSGNVGRYTSLALDSAGYPHISYYDYSYADLRYAYWDGSGWQIETVDSGGSVGEYTSLALDGRGNPHISYYDYSYADLRYAYWDGSGWQIETVDSVGSVGEDTSLALDDTGYPHISYSYYNDDLKYARWDGSAWHIETVDSAGVVGAESSLALDARGYPHISYYDGGNADLKYARGGVPYIPTTISVYTDKASYSAGETMHLGLDMTTAGPAMPGARQLQSYWLLILLRTPSTGVVVVNLPTLRLPSGWSYSNPDLFTWTLPALEPGTYAWIGMLIPVGEEPAVDSAIWTFTGSAASGKRIVPVEKALEQLGEIDLGLGK